VQPVVAPSTQPAVAPQQQSPTNWLPARAVHTIRNTVEATVSVAPVPAANQAVTGATIEP
jgi:hypothetical protein